MVAAANPLAVEAGLRVLRDGGSAVDAAVAIQAVLSLVEPQSSGLGGGSFMTFYDARTGKVTAYDGREKAPAAATPELFMGADGKPLPFVTAVLSGRSTGVPGAVAMLAQAQKEHGNRQVEHAVQGRRTLATDGFTVSPRLAGMINSAARPAGHAPDVKAYFTKPDGQRYQAGDTLKNPAYAATLRAWPPRVPAPSMRARSPRPSSTSCTRARGPAEQHDPGRPEGLRRARPTPCAGRGRSTPSACPTRRRAAWR
jgi:gamma-glutamyltranspeptidase/glutathione hydrolase